MPKYEACGTVSAAIWVGEITASSPQEAIEKAYKTAHVGLCDECSREISDPEISGFIVTDLATGETTEECTDLSKALRFEKALQKILKTSADPEVARIAQEALTERQPT